MDDLSVWVVLLIAVQVIVFVLLMMIMVRLVKVIKSQNNGKILPPDLSASLRKLFGRGK